MDVPPLAVWEGDGARAAFIGLCALSRADHREMWRRMDRLTPAQQRLVVGWICRAALQRLR